MTVSKDPMNITEVALINRIEQAWVSTHKPHGLERRSGAAADVDRFFDDTTHELTHIKRLVGSLSSDTLSQQCLSVGCFLHASGAPMADCRKWWGLSAQALVLKGDLRQAGPWACLADEQSLLDDIARGVDPPSGRSQEIGFWRLVGIKTDEHLRDDEEIEAWETLKVSGPSGQHDKTEAALRFLADWWMDFDEGWEDYYPGTYPLFEPFVCASAAVARRHGFIPTRMDPDQLIYLDAGLLAV